MDSGKHPVGLFGAIAPRLGPGNQRDRASFFVRPKRAYPGCWQHVGTVLVVGR